MKNGTGRVFCPLFNVPVPSLKKPCANIKPTAHTHQTVSVDLLPGGASVAVTNGNRTLYCHLLADFHLNRR
jgi:hypothetical protein